MILGIHDEMSAKEFRAYLEKVIPTFSREIDHSAKKLEKATADDACVVCTLGRDIEKVIRCLICERCFHPICGGFGEKFRARQKGFLSPVDEICESCADKCRKEDTMAWCQKAGEFLEEAKFGLALACYDFALELLPNSWDVYLQVKEEIRELAKKLF